MEGRVQDTPQDKDGLKETLELEARITSLFHSVGVKISPYVKSYMLMADDNFVNRRDRTSNDIHLFLELRDGQVFHLRAYTRHMLDTGEQEKGVFLTAYLNDKVTHTGGVHSLRQASYPWDAEAVFQEILKQNPGLFSIKL